MRMSCVTLALLLVSMNPYAGPSDGLEREILADQIHGQAAPINDQKTLEMAIKQDGLSSLMLIGEENIQSFADSTVFTEFGLAAWTLGFSKG